MKFHYWILASALLSLGAAPVPAQDVPPLELESVTVTATKVERGLEEIPYSVGVVDSAEIVRRGAQSVAEALRDIPGVEVHDGSVPGTLRVSIRGERGERVLILIDGQKVSEQKSMTGAVFLVDPLMIERIEVIKGPASVLYGSEAIGGVVNVITKKGGDRAVQLDVSTGFDSSTDGWNYFASLYGKINRVGYRLAGSFADHGNRRTPDGSAKKTAYESYSGSIYLDYQWDNATLGASYERVNRDLRVFTPDGVIGDVMVHFHQSLPEWSREKYSVFFDVRDLGEHLVKVSGNLFHQNVTKDFHMEMDVNPGPPITLPLQTRNRTVNDQDTLGLALQTDWLIADSHYLIVGLDILHDRLTANEYRRSRGPWAPFPPLNAPYEFSNDLFVNKAESTLYALYAQDEWSLNKDTILTLGARQTWAENKLTRAGEPGLEENSSSDNKPVFSVGLTWSGLTNTTLRASYAQGYRLPNLQQLFIGTVHGDRDPTFSNPDLDPETSDNFEIGIRYRDGRFNFDGAVFAAETKDFITTVPFPTQQNAGARRYDNVDKARTYGAEASLEYTIAPLGLTPHATLTYLRRKFESETLTTWKTNSPSLSGRAGLRFERDHSARLSYYLNPYVRFADSAEEETYSAGTGTTTVEKNPGWATLNLDAGIEFGATHNYRLALNLNNLADKRYSTARESVPMAGRHAVVSLSGSF